MHCLSFRGVCHTAASDLFPFLLYCSPLLQKIILSVAVSEGHISTVVGTSPEMLRNTSLEQHTLLIIILQKCYCISWYFSVTFYDIWDKDFGLSIDNYLERFCVVPNYCSIDSSALDLLGIHGICLAFLSKDNITATFLKTPAHCGVI